MNTQHRRSKGAPVYVIAGALIVSAVPAWAGVPDDAALRPGSADREIGATIRVEQVGSYPTPDDARARFDEWIAFYRDFFQFPADLPETFEYRLRQLQGDVLHR